MKRDKDETEARRIIARVGAETEARMQASKGTADDEQDWAEFWGKRIGRIFSVVLFFVAVYWIWQFMSDRP